MEEREELNFTESGNSPPAPGSAADGADETDGLTPTTGRAPGQKSQATRLIELCSDVVFFHTPDHEAYATIAVNGHRENYALASPEFSRWLKGAFYAKTKTAANQASMDDALGALEAKAHFDGPCRKVFLRVAPGVGDEVYIDLGDTSWQVVRVSGEGWSVLKDSPVMFRRSSGIGALPIPQTGGSIDDLRPFVNVTDEDFPLLVGFVLAALRPSGPYPLLELTGGQGTSKSTTSRIVRSLIDPTASPLRSAMKNTHDLAVACRANWVVVFDNMSHISGDVSDALCLMSTGGSFSARKLYTDAEETTIDLQRPVIINGIQDLATRSDLLERTIVLELPELRAAARRDERELWRQFEEKRPAIFGAILDGLASAVRQSPHLRRYQWPRLADAAKWITGGEQAFGWAEGTFLSRHRENRGTSAVRALDADEVLVRGIRELANRGATSHRAGWDGTASQLLDALREWAVCSAASAGELPRAANLLSRRLRRLQEPLAHVGVEVQFTRQGAEGNRFISLRQGRAAAVGVVSAVREAIFDREVARA